MLAIPFILILSKGGSKSPQEREEIHEFMQRQKQEKRENELLKKKKEQEEINEKERRYKELMSRVSGIQQSGGESFEDRKSSFSKSLRRTQNKRKPSFDTSPLSHYQKCAMKLFSVLEYVLKRHSVAKIKALKSVTSSSYDPDAINKSSDEDLERAIEEAYLRSETAQANKMEEEKFNDHSPSTDNSPEVTNK